MRVRNRVRVRARGRVRAMVTVHAARRRVFDRAEKSIT